MHFKMYTLKIHFFLLTQKKKKKYVGYYLCAGDFKKEFPLRQLHMKSNTFSWNVNRINGKNIEQSLKQCKKSS